MSEVEGFEREFRETATWQMFFKIYRQHIQTHDTYKDAYLTTERQHEQIYGRKKYASYNSFRVSYSRITNSQKTSDQE